MKIFYKILFLFILVNSNITLKASNNFIVNPVTPPTGTISGTTTVCQNGTAPEITFTGSGGSAPYTFTYDIDGVAQAPISTTGTETSVKIVVNTANTGHFNYNLTSVHDTTTPILEQPLTDQATITINALPIVDFSFTNDNSCSGTIVQFSSSVTGTATYSYAWDFGDGKTS
ncbi:hypothetical protein, partial [Flavobacterium sp.]|uniref:hypothetical protein n=1 Tax=Flavobacterium sp. TaxID=239 RepID=UPI003C6B7AFF